MFSQDYYHRKFTVTLQIALTQEAERQGFEMVFFHRYFDKKGNARANTLTSTTKVSLGSRDGFFIPDFIFLMEKADQQYFYCGEMYNGKDTKRVIAQLKKHVTALELGAPSLKYNFSKANRVLSVFEHRENMLAVLARLKDEHFFANFERYFLFKHLEEVNEAPFDDWKTIN